MKILAILLLIVSLYKMYVCTKNWVDIGRRDYNDNDILIVRGIIATESVIGFFCSMFILFG